MAPDVAENLEVGFLYCCTECTGQRNNFELIPSVTRTSSGDEIANVNFYAVRPGSYRNSLK